jgi:hypothetical protein
VSTLPALLAASAAVGNGGAARGHRHRTLRVEDAAARLAAEPVVRRVLLGMMDA